MPGVGAMEVPPSATGVGANLAGADLRGWVVGPEPGGDQSGAGTNTLPWACGCLVEDCLSPFPR